jgi:hypothetical protein
MAENFDDRFTGNIKVDNLIPAAPLVNATLVALRI